MVGRRRFIVFLLGRHAKLWLEGLGTAEFPYERFYELAGTCSFCAPHAPPPPNVQFRPGMFHEARLFAGVVGRPHRICNGCLVIGLEASAERSASFPWQQPSPTNEELLAMRFARLTPDAERHAVADMKEILDEDFSCAFCAAPRREVSALIAGPGIFICSDCISGFATAGPLDELHRFAEEKLQWAVSSTDRLIDPT